MKYTVNYIMFFGDSTKTIPVNATNKIAAYDQATYKAIPEKEGSIPYSVWVNSVCYNNGRVRTFNTFSGKPY